MSQFQIVPPHIIEITKKKKLNLIYFSWHFQLFQKEHIKYIKISSVVQPKVRLFSKSFSSGYHEICCHIPLYYNPNSKSLNQIMGWKRKNGVVSANPIAMTKVTLDFADRSCPIGHHPFYYLSLSLKFVLQCHTVQPCSSPLSPFSSAKLLLRPDQNQTPFSQKKAISWKLDGIRILDFVST